MAQIEPKKDVHQVAHKEISEATRLAACQFTFSTLAKITPMERDQLFLWIDQNDRPDIQKLALRLIEKASRRRP